MRIILGVFDGNYYKLKDSLGLAGFVEFRYHHEIEKTFNLYIQKDTYQESSYVITKVRAALDVCERCFFLLDDLWLPLPQKETFSAHYTPFELNLVTSKKEYVDKTTFYVDNKPVETEIVMKILNSEEQGYFKDIIARKLVSQA